MFIVTATALLLSVLPENTNAQQAAPSIDRDTIRTGDTFQFHVHITGVETFDDMIYPDSADFGTDFVIRNMTVEPGPDGDQLTYLLQFFGIDNRSVPELHAGLIDGTDTLFLVIPETPFIYEERVDEEEAELRPLKPIFPFFRNWWPIILGIAILAALIGYLIYRYRDRLFTRPAPVQAPKEKPLPFQSPLKALLKELARIEHAHPRPEQNAKLFHTELGDAIRTYFEHTHNVPALESTTFELLQILESRRFDDEVIRLAGTLLQQADLVKFAKYKANESDCRDVIKHAHIFAERIAIIDRPKLEALRSRHKMQQKEKISEELRYDLG
ncbi:MAG: hypothetical protein WD097_07940 [Balneolales bacterium]